MTLFLVVITLTLLEARAELNYEIVSYHEHRPILNLRQVGPEDNFVAICNYARFSRIPVDHYIISISMQRKTIVDDTYQTIAQYDPFLTEELGKYAYVPTDRRWFYKFSGQASFFNKKYMQIVLNATNAGYRDAGFYRCKMTPENSENPWLSDIFELETRAPLIVSIHSVGPGNSFTAHCDKSMFASSPNKVIVSLELQYRDLGSNDSFRTLARNPSKNPNWFIPVGRKWKVYFDQTFAEHDTSSALGITLTVGDAGCEDAGEYRCARLVQGATAYEFSDVYKLIAKEPFLLNDLIVTPKSNFGPFASLSHFGDTVTMECRYRGPKYLKHQWKIDEGRSLDDVFGQNYAYPKGQAILTKDSDNCSTYFYSKNLIFRIKTTLNVTYYCAVDNNGEESSVHFTVLVSQDGLRSYNEMMNAAATNENPIIDFPLPSAIIATILLYMKSTTITV
ncbi:hypothetical protein BgiBS90_013737 [Biomphalaria glabrata]|nr:hypothetical protein BgiBS90_013737 [Biomphalaria glabrata]